MGGETNSKGYGGYQKTSLTIKVEVYAYELKTDCKEEFKRFYNKEIRKWLAENHVAYTNGWIFDDYLIVVSSQNPSWGPTNGKGGIPGLERFVKHTKPVTMEELPKFFLTPGTGDVGDQAA